MKQIKHIIATVAVCLFTTALHAQLAPVVLDKYATPNGDGTYTLTLKSYVTGRTLPYESMRPADIIFTMDLSGSMKNNIGKDDTYPEVTKPMTGSVTAIKETTKAMTATTYDKVAATAKNPTVVTKAMTATDRTWSKAQNWTYSNLKYGNAEGTANYSRFYRDGNGDYYVVHRANNLVNSSTGKANVRAMWYVDKNGNNRYLTSDGVSDTYKDVTADGTTLWNGTLYTGWTYATHSNDSGTQCYGLDTGNADATVAKQWYYLHTDGEYYPVRRANNLPDGNGNNNVHAAWVEIGGTIYYLHGEKLDPDGYDTTVTGQYRSIWFGPLYKGGWTYTTMLAATVENGHYYLHADGKYYPVQKAQETVNGVNTYQAFVTLPEGKRYLYGTRRLSTDPCPFATAEGIFYYFGELYKGGWTYNITTDGSTGTKHYYLHTDGEYYPVRKETSTGNFQLYVDLPEGKRYFNGNDLSETPYASSTTKYVTVYFGSLYTMTGWSYAGVTSATAGAGHYYKHTDNKYYPVVKEDLGAAQTANRYQLYVDVPEGKRYLWGHSLHAEVCPYSAATATVIWYGTLYMGGWSYSTITVNASDKQGYSYLHSDGEYYPIYQKTVAVGGVTTYQDYVILPDGNEWYLCGNEISRNPYPYSVKNTVNNWFGPLYSGAWTYANTTAGNADGGYFYLHTDGSYYPVLKEDLTASAGKTRYQMYVNLPEGKRYLYGTHLSETPYPFSERTNVAIYYGTLYKGGFTYDNIKAGTAAGRFFYLHTDGMYYRLYKEDLGTSAANKPMRYQVYVDLPDLGKMYLHGGTISEDPYPTSATTGASLYFGTLYKLVQYDYTRYEGLRRAVTAFVDGLAAKSIEQGVHHRVALTQYATKEWAYTPAKDKINNPHLKQFTNAAANGNSAVLCDFKDLTDPAQVQALKDALPEGTPKTGGTAGRWGLSLARGLFLREANSDATDWDSNGIVDDYEQRLFSGDPYASGERMKILISIGDGEDWEDGSLNRTKWRTYANNVFKVDVPDAKVFVVHVQTTAISDAEKAIASPDETLEDGSVFHYYYDVKYYDETLIEALLGITDQISGAAVQLGSRAIVQDVITPEFSIPAGASIQMYTADCIGGDDTSLEFEDEDGWDAFSGSLERADNPDGTTRIRVTGFDFSANWCGNHGDEEGYAGKQLIIQIPIIPKNDIIGGIIPTNTPDSQILDEDEKPVGEYPIPEVGPFPMHIQISKSGLQEGDSAVFLIWRKLKEASSFDKTGLPFMKVVLTGNADGTEVLADIRNLDPGYSYLIEESSWSWKYKPTVLSISTDDQSTNPFVFGNTLKTDIVTKNAEAKASNEMY